MTRSLRHRISRGAAALAFAVGALVVFAPPAHAQAPTRVGWWNNASAGGAAAPAPTAPKGGIHVAAAPGQVMAYGALLYPLPADAVAGQLTLAIAGSQGTPRVRACPTTTTHWPAGGDQPSDAAPKYDCDTEHATGTVAADGKSVSFPLTITDATGPLSLAVVPDLSADTPTGVNEPFSVDFDKPNAASLTFTAAPVASDTAPPAPTATFAPGSGAAPNPPAGSALGVPHVPAPPAIQAPPPDTAAAPQLAASAPPAASPAQPAASTGGRSAASTVGTAIGGLALVVAFLLWGLGRGLLGGRILPLSAPATAVSAAEASPRTA